MPKIIKIEGVGNVAFPDNMDDTAISHAIETDILSQPGVAKNVPGTVANVAMKRGQQRDAKARSQSTVPSTDGPGPVRRFLQGAGVPTSVPEMQALGDSLDPVTQLRRGNASGKASSAATHIAVLAGPVGLVAKSMLHTIGQGMGDQAGQALDAAQQHDVGGYVRHSLGAAVPLVGPQAAEGNLAGAAGTTAALLAPSALGKASDALATRRSTVPIRTTVEAPAPGPVRRTVGNVLEKYTPGFMNEPFRPLWEGGGTRTKTTRVPLSSITDAAGGVAPVQPIRPRPVPEFDPRGPRGQFAPVKSIPLVGDPPPTPAPKPPRASTVPSPTSSSSPSMPIDGFGPSSVPPPEPSLISSPSPSSADSLVGQPVRFSRGNSRAHGTVASVRGDVARVKNASGMSVRVPVSQLTILLKQNNP